MSRTTFDNLYAAIVGSGITFCAAWLVATGDYETSAGVAVCCAGGGAAWVLSLAAARINERLRSVVTVSGRSAASTDNPSVSWQARRS